MKMSRLRLRILMKSCSGWASIVAKAALEARCSARLPILISCFNIQDYAVIAPQHAATILGYDANDSGRIEKALDVLKPMAVDIYSLGIADRIVREYPGGAHLEKKNGYPVTLDFISSAIQAAF